tara:strand:- start:572 stop:820 length:249 start_codon:yes stop_codon:yes gene_type:complete
MKRKKTTNQRQKKGKNIQNMKNSESVKLFPNLPPFSNRTKAQVEGNYWRSMGYNTKLRKEGKGFRLFKSKRTVIGKKFGKRK